MSSAGACAAQLQASTRQTSAPTAILIDDDLSVRESLEPLLFGAGWRVQAFECAEDFLSSEWPTGPRCLILDLMLPRVSGLDLQARVAALGAMATLPIIFITGFGDVLMSVRAMKAGAVEFLMKPLDDEALLVAVEEALQRSRTALAEAQETLVLLQRYGSLTSREREVMHLVIRGLLNKQAGAELGISEITVKAHRGRVMRKMQAHSLPDLVVMTAKLRTATRAVAS
jgi:FixJ family two-component response regulator